MPSFTALSQLRGNIERSGAFTFVLKPKVISFGQGGLSLHKLRSKLSGSNVALGPNAVPLFGPGFARTYAHCSHWYVGN